jgi:hypothetical protein
VKRALNSKATALSFRLTVATFAPHVAVRNVRHHLAELRRRGPTGARGADAIKDGEKGAAPGAAEEGAFAPGAQAWAGAARACA